MSSFAEVTPREALPSEIQQAVALYKTNDADRQKGEAVLLAHVFWLYANGQTALVVERFLKDNGLSGAEVTSLMKKSREDLRETLATRPSPDAKEIAGIYTVLSNHEHPLSDLTAEQFLTLLAYLCSRLENGVNGAALFDEPDAYLIPPEISGGLNSWAVELYVQQSPHYVLREAEEFSKPHLDEEALNKICIRLNKNYKKFLDGVNGHEQESVADDTPESEQDEILIYNEILLQMTQGESSSQIIDYLTCLGLEAEVAKNLFECFAADLRENAAQMQYYEHHPKRRYGAPVAKTPCPSDRSNAVVAKDEFFETSLDEHDEDASNQDNQQKRTFLRQMMAPGLVILLLVGGIALFLIS